MALGMIAGAVLALCCTAAAAASLPLYGIQMVHNGPLEVNLVSPSVIAE